MYIDTLIWLYALLILCAIVIIYTAVRMVRVRVWIKTQIKQDKPMVEIGYLNLLDDGFASEVHLMGAGKKPPIGYVRADTQKNDGRGFVDVITSDIEDETTNPHYSQCGYIVFENGNTSIDNYGYIYKQQPGKKKKELIGYCARPSQPNVPTIYGERSWKSLWLVCRLNVYAGKPEQEKDTKKDKEAKTNKDATKSQSQAKVLMNIGAKRGKKNNLSDIENADKGFLNQETEVDSNISNDALKDILPQPVVGEQNGPNITNVTPDAHNEVNDVVNDNQMQHDNEEPIINEADSFVETGEEIGTTLVDEEVASEPVVTNNDVEKMTETTEEEHPEGDSIENQQQEVIEQPTDKEMVELPNEMEAQPQPAESNRVEDTEQQLEAEEPLDAEQPADAELSSEAEQASADDSANDTGKGDGKKRKKSKAKKVPPKVPLAMCQYTGFHSSKNDYLPPEARACAYAALGRYYQKKSYAEYYRNHPCGWKDTALLTTTIYCLIFLLLYTINTGLLQMPLLGDNFLAAGILVVFYFVLWALIRMIKIDNMESSNSIQPRLYLFNKNLGIKTVNLLIVAFSLIAMAFTLFYYDYDFFPLLFAIVFGVSTNMTMKAANEKWTISLSYDENENNEDEDKDKREVKNPPGDISRSYEWDLDPNYNGTLLLHGSLTLYFSQKDIDDVRYCNPFYGQRKDKSDKEYILQMFNYLKGHKTFLARVRYISYYIKKEIDRANLTPLDRIQFTLDFIQEPNIRFVQNSKCEEINFYEDYIRFPDETLFDKQGDCNSKSLLAAMLFHTMGYNVLYLASRKYQHAAVGIEIKQRDINEGWYGSPQKVEEITIQDDGKFYIYCETTGDHFGIGSTIEGMKWEDFDEKIILPLNEETSQDDVEDPDLEVSRIYNWELDSKLGKKIHGNLTLNFISSDIEQLRGINPFRSYGKDGYTYDMNIRRMFDYLWEDSDRTENVHNIADYIKTKRKDNELTEFEMLQFVLDFVQMPNINYVIDEESSSIDYAKEYMRFPEEVLYDKEGDCDCKSSLMAAICHELGYNVIIMLSEQLQHAAIGLEYHEDWVDHIEKDTSRVLREHNGKTYVYCETTGDGYLIGHIRENESIQNFETIIELPA